MYEKLITVATMLFILSMISERVVTFFKLWCVKGNSFLFIIVSKELDTSKKYENEELENKRQRAILAINLTISFLIALISKASLFNMFTYDNSSDLEFLLGWDFPSLTFHEFFSVLIGCGLTACFISLGSKFWHDMLDMLFYAKNLKEKLVDAETYKANNLKQLDEYIETEYYELARLCWEKNKDKINSLPNIINSFVGFDSNSTNAKPVIILNSTLKNGGSYPTSFNAQLSSGKPIGVKVLVVYNYDIPTIHFGSGDNVFEKNNAQMNGTICCVVSKDTKNYLLTCAHVLTGGIDQIGNSNPDGWLRSPVKQDTFSKNNKNKTIGSWSYGIIDNLNDVALIEVDAKLELTANQINIIENHSEEKLQKKVSVNGDVNKSEGYVIGYQKDPIDFKYNGSTHQLGELIVLSENLDYLKSITEGGDSGALVYLTEEKKALGMVVGGNTQYTYAIPMKRILEITKTNLT